MRVRHLPGDQYRTPGTALVWSTFAEYVETWRTLRGRHRHHVSAKSYRDLRQHVLCFPYHWIKHAGTSELVAVLWLLEEAKPVRGRREGWPGTAGIVEVRNELTRRKRP